MNERTKELILKTLIAIGMVLLVMLFPGSIALPFLIPNEKAVFITMYTILFTFLGVGLLFMILLLIFGGLKQKPVKAEKMPLLVACYDDFFDFLQVRLLEKKYQMQKVIPIFPDGEIILFVKSSKHGTLACFAIIRVRELSEELIENANTSITSILTEYCGNKTITISVDMISVFCVDRITTAFQELVNSNVQQGFKNGRLPVGVSFGGKKIYIGKQKDGFAFTKYKRLRREFVDVISSISSTSDDSIREPE